MKRRAITLALSGLLIATVSLADDSKPHPAPKPPVHDDYWDQDDNHETLHAPDSQYRNLTDSDFDLETGVPHEKYKGVAFYKMGSEHCGLCKQQDGTFTTMSRKGTGMGFFTIDIEQNYGIWKALLEGGGVPQTSVFIDGERAVMPGRWEMDNSGHIKGGDGNYLFNIHGAKSEAELKEIIPFFKKVSEVPLSQMNVEFALPVATRIQEQIKAQKAKAEAMHHAPKPILADVTDDNFANRVGKTRGVSVLAILRKQGEDSHSDELRSLLARMAADTDGSPRWGYYAADVSSNPRLLAQFDGYFKTDKATKERSYLAPVMAIFFDGKLAYVPYETKDRETGDVETQYFTNVLPLDFSKDPAAQLIAKVKGAKNVFDAPEEE